MQRRQFLQYSATAALSFACPAVTASASGWQTFAPLPISVQEIYPTVFQGQLVVAGGIAARLGVPYFTNNVYAYQPDQDAWRRRPDLPKDLHHVALIEHAGELLAIGGFNGGYSHVWRMQSEVYRLADDTWVPTTPLPTPQAEGVLTHHRGRVHVVTGQQPKGSANTQRSDHTEGNLHWVLEDDTWSNAAPIPTPRNSATGGWIGEQLVVAGGRTARGNLDTTEIYDATSDSWHSARPLPLPQAGTAGVTHGGSLYVFGGEIFRPESAVFPNVWRYDLATDQWHALADLPTPRHGLGAGVLGNRIHVIGGATEPGGSGTSNAHEALAL